MTAGQSRSLLHASSGNGVASADEESAVEIPAAAAAAAMFEKSFPVTVDTAATLKTTAPSSGGKSTKQSPDRKRPPPSDSGGHGAGHGTGHGTGHGVDQQPPPSKVMKVETGDVVRRQAPNSLLMAPELGTLELPVGDDPLDVNASMKVEAWLSRTEPQARVDGGGGGERATPRVITLSGTTVGGRKILKMEEL